MWKPLFFLTFATLTLSAPPTNLDFYHINEFALKLLDNIYAFQENFGNHNFAVSPLSVWSTFSLLAQGASGETFEELMKELKLPRDVKATQALHRATKDILNRNDQDVILKGQSALFVGDCALQVHQEFCQLANSYRTDVYTVDTKNTTKLAEDINYYICIATDAQIKNAVQPEFLENLRLLLIDALYFKANWTIPFDPVKTKQESFFDSKGRAIGAVNMMYHKAPHHFTESTDIGVQILELPYGRNEEYSMLILLPFDGMPLKRVLNNLATKPVSWLSELRSAGKLPEIECFIPRFKVSSKLDLISPLQYSGIHTIFDAQKAELPGVSSDPLFVSKTQQNLAIEVTEEGTVAAAATVVGLEDRILGVKFEANKEFVFLITEKKTDVILFAGVYSEPALV